MFYGHFCAHGRLIGPSDLQWQRSEVIDETPFRYAYAEISNALPTRPRLQLFETKIVELGKGDWHIFEWLRYRSVQWLHDRSMFLSRKPGL